MVIGFERINASMYMNYVKISDTRNTQATGRATGRDHCPALSISNDMPESGGGGVTDGVEVAASDDDDDGGDDDGEPARETLIKKTSPSGKHRNVTATAGALSNLQSSEISLLRLPSVLARIPVSRSGWWAGVKTGRYPQPIRISPRCVAWRSSDIHALISSF